MIYVISDTHFGHKNIIKYCQRPFSDVDNMDTEMINRWNSVVNPSDTVIHVGDFSFYSNTIAQQICQELNGVKILVRGNHDKSPEKMVDIGFNLVVECLILQYGGNKYLLQHHPIDDAFLESVLDNIQVEMLIHGHSHNTKPLIASKRSRNVSVENVNYCPMKLEEVIHAY